MNDSSDSSASILFDFADQLLSDLEADRVRPLAHYLARFPGHEEHVAREYLALTGKRSSATPIVEGAREPVAEPAVARQPDRIGPYRLAEVLGRGGQGVVYRAEDVRLERTVALKVLSLPVASVSQGRRNRFRREAEIVSRLDHPGICTVLDADLDGETPYIAMRFVEGETLAAALARSREVHADQALDGTTPAPSGGTTTSASRLLAPRRALELSETLSFFERAARALHAAHEAGVIHRDVKPGNIMVSKDGAPVILDFGLARGEEEDSVPITRSDEVFGTPAYISPEQLHSGRDVDRRTDVYSLGVVLYECLTLVRPFQGDSSAALAQAIRSAPLPEPRRLNPDLPHDLAVVLETALEKDVARRYPTALELAEELRRVREYEPIRARPAGAVLRLRRWAQRNPVIATGTIGSIVALSIALVVALVLLERVGRERNEKEAALGLYEGGWYRDQAATSLVFSPLRSLHYAIAAAERDPSLASNNALLAALDALYQKQVLFGHREMVMQVDIDRTSERVLTSSNDGTARVWNAHTGLELARFASNGGPVLCARFSPDGERLVTTGRGGQAFLWRAALPDAPPLALAGHTGDVHWAEFSPDGARVATASRDHTARVFDAESGRELARLEGHTGSVAEARFLDAGRLVLTRSAEPPVVGTTQESDFTARLFDAHSGAQLRVFRGHTAAILSFDASCDGRWLVTTSEDHSARSWRLDEGPAEPEPVRVFDAPGKFHSAEFSPDGRRLALAWDAGAKVVDVESGAELYTLPSHEHRAIVRITFSPDGRQLATVGYDNALRVFRAADGALLRLCRGETQQVFGLRWSPDGSFLATWQRSPTVDLWYGGERPFLQVLRGHTGEVRSSRFDRTGTHILTASADGTARTWSASTAEIERVLDPSAQGRALAPLIAARFDLGGERIATTDENGRVLLWSARDGSLLGEYDSRRPTSLPASFSPDGTRLLMAESSGCALIVEIGSGRKKRLAAHAAELSCLTFSADGTRVATGGEDRRVCWWDASFAADAPLETVCDAPIWRSPPFEARMYSLKTVFDVAISPDGRWVAAACQSASIELFDSRDGRLCNECAGPTAGRLVFSGDGRALMAASKYYNLATMFRIEGESGGGRLERVPLRDGPGIQHNNSLTCIGAAAQAQRVVTGSLDRTARSWDLVRRECFANYVGHGDTVMDADITADGELIVTASADGTARLWPGDVLATAKRCEPAAFAKNFGPLPTPVKRE